MPHYLLLELEGGLNGKEKGQRLLIMVTSR